MDMHNFANCVVSFGVTCWMFIIFLLTYFASFIFLFSSASTLEIVLAAQSLFPLQFPLADVIIAMDGVPSHCAFWGF